MHFDICLLTRTRVQVIMFLQQMLFGAISSHAPLPPEQTVAKCLLVDWHLFVTQSRWKQKVDVENLIPLHAYSGCDGRFSPLQAISSGKAGNADRAGEKKMVRTGGAAK